MGVPRASQSDIGHLSIGPFPEWQALHGPMSGSQYADGGDVSITLQPQPPGFRVH